MTGIADAVGLGGLWWAAIAWSLAGLVLGALVHVLRPWRGASWWLTFGVGLAGAWAGGVLATLLGFGGLAGFDAAGLATAALAALLALLLHAWLRARALVAAQRPAPALTARGGAVRSGARPPAG